MALIDVFPLESPVRDRIDEMFRHDDHAGDIVPFRRARSRPPAAPEPSQGFLPKPAPVPTSARASGPTPLAGRATTARPILVPSTPKIELECEAPAPVNPRSTYGQNFAYRKLQPSNTSFEPKTIVKWILIVAIGGPLLQWLFSLLNQHK